MDIRINGSRESNDGILVWLECGNDKDFYYMHGITQLGDENDLPGYLHSMWGWINHMREKNWWNKDIEAAFIKTCMKYLK